MIKKTIINISVYYYLKRGYSPFFARQMLLKLWDDFLDWDINLSRKLWAYRRKFLARTVVSHEINDENYEDYLPDLVYYKMHPLNLGFSKWIDDKLTIRYILEPFSNYFPEYYFHFYRNKILKIFECPKNYSGTIDDVIDLLYTRKILAFKQISGSVGKGFYIAEYTGDNLYLNKHRISETDFREKCRLLNDYIVTEYLEAHSTLKKLYPHAVNAVRVIVIRTDQGECEIIAAHISIGTKATGFTEHIPLGGILAKVDLNSGKFSNFMQKVNNIFIPCSIHPDTGKKLKGKVHQWPLIKKTIKQISDYLPELQFMGFDLAITQKGMKILEINSFPGMVMQKNFPLLKDGESRIFFDSRR